jgi:hypothetical protein
MIASRLAGVTRALDDAALQFEDRAEAGRHAPHEGQQRQNARQEEVEHVPARHNVLQQRREQRQVQDRGGESHDQPDRVAQQLGDVALE